MIKNKIILIYKKVLTKYINFLNHKFKKYIIKYEECGDNIKIYNSNGDYKIVNGTIANKVKVLDIISIHRNEINERIEYYYDNKSDNTIIFLTSSLGVLMFGCMFILSFFFGSYLLLLISLLSFSTVLYLYINNTYKMFLFREEVKRLKNICENKIILNDNELKEIFVDIFKIIKNYFYEVVEKVVNIFDNIKVYFN